MQHLKVYTATALAKIVGRSRTAIQSAKTQGFVFIYGLRTTEKSWWDWLAKNPDFRVMRGFQPNNLRRPDYSRRLKALKRSRRTNKAPVPPVSPSDKSGE